MAGAYTPSGFRIDDDDGVFFTLDQEKGAPARMEWAKLNPRQKVAILAVKAQQKAVDANIDPAGMPEIPEYVEPSAPEALGAGDPVPGSTPEDVAARPATGFQGVASFIEGLAEKVPGAIAQVGQNIAPPPFDPQDGDPHEEADPSASQQAEMTHDAESIDAAIAEGGGVGGIPTTDPSGLTFMDDVEEPVAEEPDLTADAMAEYEGAIERQKAGVQMQSEATAPALQSSVQRLQQLQAADEAGLSEEDRAMRGGITRYETALNTVRNTSIDSNRWFKNQSTPRKFLAALVIGLGGLTQRHTGRNVPLEIIRDAIARDIADQQAEMQKNQAVLGSEQNLMAMWTQVFGNQRAGRAAARATQLELAKAMVAEQGLGGQTEQLLGQLDEEIAKEKLKLAAAAGKAGGKVLPSHAVERLGALRAAADETASLRSAFNEQNKWGAGWAWLTQRVWGTAARRYENSDRASFIANLVDATRGVASDQDRLFFNKQTPESGDTRETAEQKLRAVEKRLRAIYGRSIEAYTKAKYDVSEFDPTFDSGATDGTSFSPGLE